MPLKGSLLFFGLLTVSLCVIYRAGSKEERRFQHQEGHAI